MELRTMRYFLEIASEKNMTAAANNLHVSQSALSHQMRELEDELGCILFNRTNRQTLLTDDGKRFRNRIEEILTLVDRTDKEFRFDEKEIYGQVSIGAGETSFVEHLGNAAVRLREKHPGITFSVFSGIADDIFERMDKGLLDFALLFEPVDKNRLNYIDIPIHHVGGILVKSDHPLAKKDSVTTDDIKGIPLIVNSRRVGDEEYLSGVFRIPRKDMNIVCIGNLNFNKTMLARSGLGIVLCSSSNGSQGDGVKFIPFEPRMVTKMIFAWRKGQTFSKAAELYLKEVREELNKIEEEFV